MAGDRVFEKDWFHQLRRHHLLLPHSIPQPSVAVIASFFLFVLYTHTHTGFVCIYNGGGGIVVRWRESDDDFGTNKKQIWDLPISANYVFCLIYYCENVETNTILCADLLGQ